MLTSPIKIEFKNLPSEESQKKLAYILMNLRKHTKYWSEHYGAGPRLNKEYWENKADEWINDNVKTEL